MVRVVVNLGREPVLIENWTMITVLIDHDFSL